MAFTSALLDIFCPSVTYMVEFNVGTYTYEDLETIQHNFLPFHNHDSCILRFN